MIERTTSTTKHNKTNTEFHPLEGEMDAVDDDDEDIELNDWESVEGVTSEMISIDHP